MLRNNLGPFIHLGLPVLNIEKAKTWYRDTMGYKVIHEPSLSIDGMTIHISFLQKAGIMLEFYELSKDEIAKYSHRDYGFIDHFTMKVYDLDLAANLLEKNGAKEIDRQYCVPGNGQRSQMYKGIYGEKILIVESNESDFEDFTFVDVGVAYFNREDVANCYKKIGFEFVEESEEQKIFYYRYKNMVIKFFWETDEMQKKRNDGYIDHIAFDIRNINDAYHDVEAAGFSLIEERPIELPFWEKGIKYFNFRGASGEKIELEQRL